ncbi:hypothetical protein ACFL1H_05170 [Nanoarchaeota archaeon]
MKYEFKRFPELRGFAFSGIIDDMKVNYSIEPDGEYNMRIYPINWLSTNKSVSICHNYVRVRSDTFQISIRMNDLRIFQYLTSECSGVKFPKGLEKSLFFDAQDLSDRLVNSPEIQEAISNYNIDDAIPPQSIEGFIKSDVVETEVEEETA